ncbi:MAG TPA: hypothetical protein VFB63_33625, partial [Bryobacteraceae bacterium]|nr:hypothetical protein [Bryobacteraceae bacterium]
SIGVTGLPVFVSAAYDVPVELNIETSGGRPTTMGACDIVHPLRNIRRDKRILLVMTEAIV